MNFIILVFIASLIFSINGSGKTITVDDGGGADYETIQYAIDNATDGDTIQVKNGIYMENVEISKPLTLIGEDQVETIISASNSNWNTIQIESDHVNIRQMTIMNGSSGIRFKRSEDCIVEDCVLTGNNVGIFINLDTNNCEIRDCIIDNNRGNGVSLSQNSDNCIIQNCIITGSPFYGIHIDGECDNNIISNCNISNNGFDGIHFTGLNGANFDNVIRDCYISNNHEDGIELAGTTVDTIVENNEFYNDGIFLEHNENIKSNNVVDGKPLYYSYNEDFQTIPDDQGAVILVQSSNSTIVNQKYSNSDFGILLVNSNDCIIENVEISTCRNAIFSNSKRMSVSNSTFSYNEYGINHNGGSKPSISTNNFLDNDYGAYFYRMDEGDQIVNNHFENNQKGGLKLEECESFHIESNIFNQNGIIFDGLRKDHFNTNILELNTINEKPILFLQDDANSVISGNEYGQIFLLSCENVTLSSINISHSSGLFIIGSQGCSILNSSFNDNAGNGISFIGIQDHHVDENIVSNSILSNNSEHGISFDNQCDENDINSCNIERNGDSGIFFLKSDNNVVRNSYIQYNQMGINLIWFSTGNTVSNNQILGNAIYGISTQDPIEAISIWWGHESGPYHPENNPNGSGDNISIEITFSPWSLTPLDYHLPQVNISIIPKISLEGQSVEFSAYASAYRGISRYVWQSDIDGEFYNGTSSVINVTNLTTGTHSISLMVLDDFNYWSEPTIITIIVNQEDVEAPSINVTSQQVGLKIKGNFTITGSAMDNIGVERVEYRIQSDDTWSLANGTSSWSIILNTYLLGDGDIIVEIRSFDGTQYSNITELSFTVDNIEGEVEDEDDNFLMEEIGPLPIVAYVGLLLAFFIVIFAVRIGGSKNKPNSSIPDSATEPITNTVAPPPFQPPSSNPQQSQQQNPQNTSGQSHQYSYPAQTQHQPHVTAPSPKIQSYPQTPQVQQQVFSGSWICPQCNGNNQDQFAFCMNCGYKRN